jgi:hypothetical protein
MTHRRTVIALCLTLAALLAFAALSRPDSRVVDGRAAAAASGVAGASGDRPAAALQGASEAAQRVDAVRTVKLFCDLVGSRQLWRAAALFATPRVWTRRELHAVRQLDFVSARVHVAPDPHTLVVVARVFASAESECPVRDGDITLFFTLGRVGTTAGGWLITAVTTSP